MQSQGKNTINLLRFCTVSVPEFTPLGGSRPDTAVVACAAVGLYTGGLPEGVVVAFDVLDTALAVLCAPLIITHVRDLRGREAHFGYPVASVRLRTTEEDVLAVLRSISADMPGCELSISVLLSETELRDGFMQRWAKVGQVDLGQTSMQRIGDVFLGDCCNLTRVMLPSSLTEVGSQFLQRCQSLRHVDMRHTALRTVGPLFAHTCRSLTSVALPDTVTDVGRGFLDSCGRVQVTSASTAVQEAVAKHDDDIVTDRDYDDITDKDYDDVLTDVECDDLIDADHKNSNDGDC